MSVHLSQPDILPLGVDGILVRFAKTLTEAANARALAFRDQVENASLAGVKEAASSLVSVRVEFDPMVTNRAAVTKAITALLGQPAVGNDAAKRVWHIPVAFGPDHAPQLSEAAALAGVTPQQAVADIEAATVRVIAIGFAPGQPYLGMLPEHWDIARQKTLTESLPRGALIVAVRQLIIWAADAPTGWRHIGQTDFQVYRPEAQQPFAFTPGDTVQFHAVSDAEFSDIQANPDTNGGASCELLR